MTSTALTTTILICDDHESYRKILTDILKNLPDKVRVESRKAKAIACLPRMRPTVVVTDLTPDSSNGATAFDLIRGVRAYDKRITIIVISGSLTSALAQKARRFGANHCIRKPFKAALVRKFVAKGLGPRSLTRYKLRKEHRESAAKRKNCYVCNLLTGKSDHDVSWGTCRQHSIPNNSIRPRKITPQERAWLIHGLESLRTGEYATHSIDLDTGKNPPPTLPIDPQPYLDQIDKLVVVNECRCGVKTCHTVKFRQSAEVNPRNIRTLVWTLTDDCRTLIVSVNVSTNELVDLEIIGKD